MDRIRRDIVFYLLGGIAMAAGVKWGWAATLPVVLIAMTLSMWNTK